MENKGRTWHSAWYPTGSHKHVPRGGARRSYGAASSPRRLSGRGAELGSQNCVLPGSLASGFCALLGLETEEIFFPRFPYPPWPRVEVSLAAGVTASPVIPTHPYSSLSWASERRFGAEITSQSPWETWHPNAQHACPATSALCAE